MFLNFTQMSKLSHFIDQFLSRGTYLTCWRSCSTCGLSVRVQWS